MTIKESLVVYLAFIPEGDELPLPEHIKWLSDYFRQPPWDSGLTTGGDEVTEVVGAANYKPSPKEAGSKGTEPKRKPLPKGADAKADGWYEWHMSEDEAEF